MTQYIIKFFLLLLLIVVIYTVLAATEFYSGINFHEYFNPDLYKLPTLLEIPNVNDNEKEEFIKNIEIGKYIANNSRIVICSLARNISEIFEKSKERMEYIVKNFKEYKIVIFENDSNDNSRELIKNWSKNNKNVILLNCCDLGNCECKLKTKTGYEYGGVSLDRFKKMALYRQQYIDYITKNLNDYDYMLVNDFDLDGNINIYGLFDCLSKKDWAAIFCNGRTPLFGTFGSITLAYDSIAFLLKDDNYNQNKYNIMYFINKTYEMNNELEKNHYFEVKSAFNGYGIYKIKSIIGCSYIGNNNLCEHVNLAKCLYDKNEKIYLNSYWTGYFNHQGENPFYVIMMNLKNLFLDK